MLSKHINEIIFFIVCLLVYYVVAFFNKAFIYGSADLFFLPTEAYSHSILEIIPFLVCLVAGRMPMWARCFKYLDRFIRDNAPYYVARGLSAGKVLTLCHKLALKGTVISGLSLSLIGALLLKNNFGSLVRTAVMYVILQELVNSLIIWITVIGAGKKGAPLTVIMLLASVVCFHSAVFQSGQNWTAVLNSPVVIFLIIVSGITINSVSVMKIRKKEY